MKENNNPLVDKKVEGKSWFELMKTFKPDITLEDADYILWNETCYPFDDETAAKQLIEYFENKKQ